MQRTTVHLALLRKFDEFIDDKGLLPPPFTITFCLKCLNFNVSGSVNTASAYGFFKNFLVRFGLELYSMVDDDGVVCMVRGYGLVGIRIEGKSYLL